MYVLREILLPTATICLHGDIAQSLMRAAAYSLCIRNPTVNETNSLHFFEICNDTQPWILDLVVVASVAHICLAVMALMGLYMRKGHLMMPWILSELMIMSYKWVVAIYFSYFYPIWTYTLDISSDKFDRIYIEHYLEFFVEITIWFFISFSHDEMNVKRIFKGGRKRTRKKVVHGFNQL